MFLGIVCISHVVSVIENRILGDDHTCLFFPNNLLADVFLKLFCNIFSFYLPVIIVLLNFRAKKKPIPDVREMLFRAVMFLMILR